ncbi:sensor histidine kinase [Flaviaesturariibacter aridisoli]|uniref:histidine kinase n=1 Tax=Flaviaesturariibacter aridisoli TaxID=2545761 RepID=A0A4R4DZG0_9BACT|nr:ATP-binding protein [Flaviaesturariibacter aridisoli]TCZ71814.1 PAS domain S-box protein [Flaviaesturariibacter aridisoli]
MHELARVRLENEMDLILAHRRAMKLAELAGLSLSAQTTFATAVSEVVRDSCESGRCGTLTLGVETGSRHERAIVATLQQEDAWESLQAGLANARRLVSRVDAQRRGADSRVDLFYSIAPAYRIDLGKIDEWRQTFRNEPPVSPYDELKRRNEQLQELSDRVQKSETQYKTLTNALPLIIFSLNADGELLYANQWLHTYTGRDAESLNRSRWADTVHPDDYPVLSGLLHGGLHTEQPATVRLELRLRQDGTGAWLWHQVTLTPFPGEAADTRHWIGYMADINAQKIVEETLKDNIELKKAQERLSEQQAALEQTIRELNRSNHELQQFAYVASHDLQEPVRKMMYYSDYLIDQYGPQLAGRGRDYLKSMQSAAHRMRSLIHDILALSQIGADSGDFVPVDLNAVAADALQDLEIAIQEKDADVQVGPLPTLPADAAMMRQLFVNLVGNALKYAQPGRRPVIRVEQVFSTEGDVRLRFADNGIGFDEKYLPRLFGLFQRLQHEKHYEGTGIGLAICKKIMDVHGGRIWAEGRAGEGATFYVSFPATA